MSRLLRASCAVAALIAGCLSAFAQSSATLPEITVNAGSVPGSFPQPIERPVGQTQTTLEAERFKASPVFSAADLLMDSPGISVKQGNGPRDVGISIRGSNARNGFGVRNIMVFEDGFPVTQPDGLSRTDLIDPHAYGAADVYRGPSSAMFGNFATGGAINFRMKPGREIDGIEYGFDAGSFNYLNNYLLMGKKRDNFEATLFGSDVRGDGHLSHSKFDTQTVNLIGHYAPTADDRLSLKFINNLLDGKLPTRQSLNQFFANPYQRNCLTAATAATGCPTTTLSGVSQTTDQANFNRKDRRTIVGARWEHDFGNQATWRNQFVFDDRNINQPTGSTSAVGDFPSYNVVSDFTKREQLFGWDVTHFVAAFWNGMKSSSDTLPVLPSGGTGPRSSNVAAEVYNFGGRLREDIRFNEQWSTAYGIGFEFSKIDAVSTAYNTSGVITSVTPAQRDFFNVAPDFGINYRVNSEWQLRARVGTGYGVPQTGNLFVTSAGVAGNNTSLLPQTNVGYDAGVDWTPGSWLKLSVTGFYEYFQNEFVTQSPGVGLQNFTFNAPASEHRGVELAVDWRPYPGWRLVAAYSYNDQFFTDFTEQLTSGAVTRRFSRAGNKIPGISPSELTARLGYDQPSGPAQGLGAFVEYVWKDSFYMDNGNLLGAPGYSLVNANVHYDMSLNNGYIKGALWFFEVKNIFDKTYIASANNISNTITGTGVQNGAAVLAENGTGSIYAGAPRSFVGGMRLRF